MSGPSYRSLAVDYKKVDRICETIDRLIHSARLLSIKEAREEAVAALESCADTLLDLAGNLEMDRDQAEMEVTK